MLSQTHSKGLSQHVMCRHSTARWLNTALAESSALLGHHLGTADGQLCFLVWQATQSCWGCSAPAVARNNVSEKVHQSTCVLHRCNLTSVLTQACLRLSSSSRYMQWLLLHPRQRIATLTLLLSTSFAHLCCCCKFLDALPSSQTPAHTFPLSEIETSEPVSSTLAEACFSQPED